MLRWWVLETFESVRHIIWSDTSTARLLSSHLRDILQYVVPFQSIMSLYFFFMCVIRSSTTVLSIYFTPNSSATRVNAIGLVVCRKSPGVWFIG